MTKKFTEEQYQKIVEKWEREISYIEATKDVIKYLAVEGLGDNISEKALALANPLTREWSHDKFVEKEKHYIWKLNGLYLVKSTGDGSIFFGSSDAAMALSESQIKEWGFNPEMFNKEEV